MAKLKPMYSLVKVRQSMLQRNIMAPSGNPDSRDALQFQEAEFQAAQVGANPAASKGRTARSSQRLNYPAEADASLQRDHSSQQAC